MHTFSLRITAAIAIAYQAAIANAWAYSLGVLHNQATSYDGGGNVIISHSDISECFTDAPNTCGNCGINPIDEGYQYNQDITNPSVYENDDCGDPCVTYDSAGMSNDDIINAPVDTPAGTLTVGSSGEQMNCKVLQSSDCSDLGAVGYNAVSMYVVCDPGI